MERIYTVDGITGNVIEAISDYRCLLDIVQDRFVLGYTMAPTRSVEIYIDSNFSSIRIPEGKFEDHIVYNNATGTEFLDFNVPIKQLVIAKYTKTSGYPYSFAKKYEAVENFNLFKGKQHVVEDIPFPISKYVKYTFGLEFETSVGIIPEELCFRDGLIPLRDGSISGNEYSTVVLSGNKGFNLLYQQLKTLRKYTRFDKECSLHIHLGGFPLIPEKILSLYNLCYALQKELQMVLPKYTFYTSRYKASQKDYCKLLPSAFDTFDKYYSAFVGRKFLGDLHQGHPNDVERARKWQIHERYYWANLLNLICYKVNKTMEFRMLRPTYNLEKILFWIYIFNAIMQFAEKHNVTSKAALNMEHVLNDIYPTELATKLMYDFYKCEVCSDVQTSLNDYIGSRLEIEEEFFEKDKII